MIVRNIRNVHVDFNGNCEVLQQIDAVDALSLSKGEAAVS